MQARHRKLYEAAKEQNAPLCLRVSHEHCDPKTCHVRQYEKMKEKR